MLPLINALTALLNHWFAAPIVAIMTMLGIHAAHPTHPINNAIAMQLIVMTLLILFFIAARLSLNVEKPGAIQHTAEWIHEFVGNQADQVIGHGYERYMPFVTTILLFVLTCNFFGLLPGFETPTADPVAPLGIALLTFIYYNFHGVRVQGPVKYAKHFAGPIWWIAWLMFPIEIISHLARIMSLTIRLFANMLASDLITLVAFSLIPFAVPVLGLGLHFAVSLIQAYIFMLLAMIYLAMAVTHEEEASI
ncbi:MAG TPA: F0F1 ATP synthase subunit A [Acidobacteriaceae bacterium]|nr:F0F1 ATP synthase subunit A [Acidobacteriaceae bacterium]